MAPKRPYEETGDGSAKERKKQRIAEARTISTQSGQASAVTTNSLSGLPGAIDVEKFVEARAFEISAMQSARKNVEDSATHRVWQTLPRFLRRRAASHDVRRVPVRLRQKAKAEMDPVKKRKLNRKISRAGMSKKIAKTQQFLKRQRDKTWLETHIWHAKRMHMKNLWGYRLAETPTEKAHRPSHRAAVHASILHDASYFGTISISGKQPVLEKLLNGCCDCQGAKPSAVRYSLGSRIQETHLYKWHSYPLDLIAPIIIIWRPLSTDNTSPNHTDAEKTGLSNHKKPSPKMKKDKATPPSIPIGKSDPSIKRTLWIRVHPSAWSEVWVTLKEACSNTLEEFRKEQKGNTEKDLESEMPEESIELVDLRSRINCFEIIGPKSSQVLRGVLTADHEERTTFHEFWSQLRNVQTPGAVPRGMVVGLQVIDPRLGFPPKNAKALVTKDKDKDKDITNTSQSHVFSSYPNVSLAQSKLWDEVQRDDGPLRPRFRKKELDDRRRQNLVPGTRLKPEKKDDRIPLLLVQRSIGSSASSNTPLSRSSPGELAHIHGWSLFFPAHWSMAFLNSLTYTGTRVGGLRERRTQVFESGSLDFPFDYPSTPAYEREALLSAQAERETWERKPPAKRVEWESVGTRSPWKADWEAVLGFASVSDGDPDLLETQRGAEDMTMPLKEKMWFMRGTDVGELIYAIADSSDPGSALLHRLNEFRNKRCLPVLQNNSSDTLFKSALVPIKLNICGRGAPNDLAAIYDVDPVEADYIRSILAKKREGDIFGDVDEKLSELTAGNDVIIGYVTTGNFSLSRGKGLAVGAIALSRLVRIHSKEKQHSVNSFPLLVKVKDRNSSICRVATLRVL